MKKHLRGRNRRRYARGSPAPPRKTTTRKKGKLSMEYIAMAILYGALSGGYALLAWEFYRF